MREALEYVFSSFWIWLGCLVLVYYFRPVRIVQRGGDDDGFD